MFFYIHICVVGLILGLSIRLMASSLASSASFTLPAPLSPPPLHPSSAFQLFGCINSGCGSPWRAK